MKYRITTAALTKAIAFTHDGIKEEVLHMAEFSAPVTHKFGNRRFEGYILRVKGGTIIDINLATAGENGKPVAVICDTCEGDGKFCQACYSKGYRYL